MNRPIISSEEGALLDLGHPPSRPYWLERDLSLPFGSLRWDEFEVFCYLLLLRENSNERITYYGKTADLGRDILLQHQDGAELVQCKNSIKSVDVGTVRREVAKLFINLFLGLIPDRPARISFYVTGDLTSPARQLLAREHWVAESEKALRSVLKKAPAPELLDFARTWWPAEGMYAEPGIALTDRAARHPELVDKFFAVKKVVEGSMAEFREALVEVLTERDVVAPVQQTLERTWEGFFEALKKQPVAPEYITAWPMLTPEERFEPPEEFLSIQESVQTQPLTILIGPPAVGKTFLALQILWKAFQQGRPCRWIAADMIPPTEGPIPGESAGGAHVLQRRIQNLAATLGIEAHRPPLDRHEFIAKNLKPGSMVYIEDPFGRTAVEFEHSLHTYKFFDLDECVASIREGAARAGCHILISSREGLFERWKEARAKKRLPEVTARLIRISGASYSQQQLDGLALRLARSRGLHRSEEVADEISYRVELPFEIESILRDLPLSADRERAAAEAMRFREDWRAVLRQTLAAEMDEEKLLLAILAAGCIDPKTQYLRLHQALALPGDAEDSLNRAVERYRAFVVRTPVSFSLSGYGPEANEVFSPSHSVVTEAIKEYLRSFQPGSNSFVSRLARALPQVASNRKSISDGAKIVLHLLSIGIGCQAGPEQDAVLTVLLERRGFSLHHVRPLMELWSSLGTAFKNRFVDHLQAGLSEKPRKPTRSVRDLDGNTRTLLLEVASTLTLVELPAGDAWRLTRLLFRKEVFGMSGSSYGLYAWESPWSYLFGHLNEAPNDILGILGRIAEVSPYRFVFILGEAAVAHWEDLSESNKAAFFAERSLGSPQVQGKALRGIARRWDTAPKELRDLFIRQAASDNPEIRLAAARAAWLGRQSSVLQGILLNSARDPDVRIPLRILDSLGDEEEDRRFAYAFFERADATLAAAMLPPLLQPGLEPLPPWKLDLSRECLGKGGDRASSRLAFLHFREKEAATGRVREWRDSLVEEPEPIRLGALWAYGHSSGRSPQLEPNDVITLVQGLKTSSRSLALAYLSARERKLPEPLRGFLRALETVENTDGSAVRIGMTKRGSEERIDPWSFLSLMTPTTAP